MRQLNKQNTKLRYCRTHSLMSRCTVRANFPRQDWRPCHRALERLQNEILVARQERILESIKTMEKKNKHMKKNSQQKQDVRGALIYSRLFVLCVKKCYHQVYSFVTQPVSDAEFFPIAVCALPRVLQAPGILCSLRGFRERSQ